jgi:hypothetical protein
MREQVGRSPGSLCALIANGYFDRYWRYHLRKEHERVHHARYRESYDLAA